MTFHRTARLLAAAVTLAVAVAVTACTGSALDNNNSDQPRGKLTIGLLVPQTGPYKAIGDDMLRGWNLYLAQHDNTLGGHPVKVVAADEADGGSAARSAVDKLLKADRSSVIVGTATAPAVSTIAAPVTDAQVPFVGVGGRPSTIDDISYMWHTSFASTDYGKAIGRYLADNIDGPVYVIGPDYQGGWDQIGGFVDAFTAAGGQLANPDGKPTFTPWPATDNFGPWLSKVKDSGAKAVYAFYAGAPAVGFVKQYQQFVGTGVVPLYAAAFLTEGGVLPAQGEAADGIYTCANYAAGLHNPVNKAFAQAFTAKYHMAPNLYHVTSYDAAALLDRAIAAAGPNPTPQDINSAIGTLGTMDSPRGSWTFSPGTHTPVQRWYLRQVRAEGAGRVNAVLAELGTV